MWRIYFDIYCFLIWDKIENSHQNKSGGLHPVSYTYIYMERDRLVIR